MCFFYTSSSSAEFMEALSPVPVRDTKGVSGVLKQLQYDHSQENAQENPLEGVERSHSIRSDTKRHSFKEL